MNATGTRCTLITKEVDGMMRDAEGVPHYTETKGPTFACRTSVPTAQDQRVGDQYGFTSDLVVRVPANFPALYQDEIELHAAHPLLWGRYQIRVAQPVGRDTRLLCTRSVV
jgi:hypothetical protein